MRLDCSHSNGTIMCDACFKGHVIGNFLSQSSGSTKIERIKLILNNWFACPVSDQETNYIKMLNALNDIYYIIKD